jgi:hypothetical protein
MGSSLEPTREGLQNVLRHRRGFSDLVLATWSPRKLNDRRTFCTFMLKAAMARYFHFALTRRCAFFSLGRIRSRSAPHYTLVRAMMMNSPSIRRISVAGAGVLGAQIAFQAAVHGFNLFLYDVNDSALAAGRRRLEGLKAAYDGDGVASPEGTAAALVRTTLTTSLSDALVDADLLIEAIPERLDIKQAFYAQLRDVAPVKTIFASNSSTMVPSQLSAYTGRPERFLHLHFATPVWRHNIAEIMAHPHTDPAVFEAVITFSRQMGMVPIPLKKGSSQARCSTP